MLGGKVALPASLETAMEAPRKYAVVLTPEQRQRLEDLTHNGHAPAKKLLHARVLLLADQHHPDGRWHDVQIAAALGLHVNTVARVRKQFATAGEQPALDRKPRQAPPSPPKIDGRIEAHLVATCCSPPPDGRARWTLSLLVEDLTRRGFVTGVCRETVRRALKKTNCSLGGSSAGASPSATGRGSSPRWRMSSTSTRRPATTTATR
jgi:Homeodomain-like domain